MMVVPLTEVSEQVLESNFIDGLRLEIQAELRMLQRTRLGHLMALAQQVDERNMKLKQAKYALGPANSRPTNQTISYPPRNQALPHSAIRATLPMESKGEVKREMQFKRLIEAEIMDKRVRGLCYCCDEKYEPGH